MQKVINQSRDARKIKYSTKKWKKKILRERKRKKTTFCVWENMYKMRERIVNL